jgi:hypothetical protein
MLGDPALLIVYAFVGESSRKYEMGKYQEGTYATVTVSNYVT